MIHSLSMHQCLVPFFLNGILPLLVLLYSCKNSDVNQLSITDESIEINIDSVTHKYVENFIKKEKELISLNKRVNIKNSYLFSYKYFFDNKEISNERFFEIIEKTSIKHITKTIGWQVANNKKQKPDKLTVSENRDQIIQQRESLIKLSAYSQNFVASRLIEIDHLDIHYSKYNVLYLSLGSSITGKLNVQVYNYETGEVITAYYENDFKGSYYIGNGIRKRSNSTDTNHLNGTNKIRVVTMIDDQFSFQEFDMESIVEEQ